MASIIVPQNHMQRSPEEHEKTSFYELLIEFFFTKYEKLVRRIGLVSLDFLDDFTTWDTYMYPMRGLSLLIYSPAYWPQACLKFIVYLIYYWIYAALYYILLFPFVLGLHTVMFGPPGVIVACIHSTLHVNLAAVHVSRTFFEDCENSFFDGVIKMNGHESFLTRLREPRSSGPAIESTRSTPGTWTTQLLWAAFKFSIKTTLFLLAFALSFVPIVGPLVVKQFYSASRAHEYRRRHFELLRLSTEEEKLQYYEEYGFYTAFGVSTSLLEFLPIISGITISSNYMGSALWTVRGIEEDSRTN